ncbi:unnamed protein product [Urochloa decumbens]|uniref:Nucleoporin autopeptidase n=1 Tax=Urochloa decumbens TaxID=240449 RepID=A0ABC8WVT0_9POAL
MFGSTNPFGQPSTSPFGQNSFGTQQGFGQATPAANNPFAPKPFGSPTTTFGAQTGSSLFGATSTGAFGQQQSTLAFGTTSTGAFGQQQSNPTFGTPSSSPFGSTTAFGASPTPAFGATSSTFGSGSLFGQKPSFGGFGSSPSQPSAFGSTFQQTQPIFGSSSFGASATPAFGTTTTPAFGATTTPTFGATTPAFGTTTTPAFGAATTPAFGSTSSSLFGANSTPAFGSSTPGFGTSGTTAFGVSSTTPGFGSSSTPSFGTSNNTFSFGSSPPFGQTTVSSASSPFGATSSFGVQTPAFGSQTTAPAFGQAQFGNQARGTRIKPYAQTPDADGATSGTQAAAKLDSISAMPEYKDKSHEELRWEDYQRGDKGGPNPSAAPAMPAFPASTPPNTFTANNPFSQPTSNPFSSNNPFTKPASTGASLFNNSSSSTTGTIFGQTGVSAFPANNSPSLFPNTTPGFASSSPFGTSTASFGTGLSLANTQSAPLFQPSASFAQQPLSTPALSSGNLFNPPSTSGLFGSGSSLFSTPTLQTSAAAQTSNMFSFQPLTQPASAGGFPGFSNTANQALIGQQTPSQSNMVMQPAPVSNPFGTLPAMPQMSIGNGGSSPSVQYGISSLPVAEKALPSRTLSMAVPRHLSQRRIKLLPRKYNPISDGKVPFFADDEESPATPKADAFFIPRENPRNLIIRPIEKWPSRSGIDRQLVPKDSANLDRYEDAPTENGHDKTVKSPSSKPSLVENGKQHEPSHHGNGEVTSVERLLPKLPQADYFTEPSLEELAAKERGEPGYCGQVKDFVVGRHGYGSIKFFGETDVRGLDLESIVEFNNREVIVYKDDSKKPPVGEGLNKSAEVTLLNIKCVNKKTGEQYHEGSRVERYREMLMKKAEEQGAEFVSFDAAKGEWKFRVKHFSAYGLW